MSYTRVCGAHTCNTNYLRAVIRRIKVWSQPRQTFHKTTISKNNKSKMFGRCGLSGRAPALWVSALQVQNTEFKPQSHPKKKKKVSWKVNHRLVEWVAWRGKKCSLHSLVFLEGNTLKAVVVWGGNWNAQGQISVFLFSMFPLQPCTPALCPSQ
jgi:hypothetical protein